VPLLPVYKGLSGPGNSDGVSELVEVVSAGLSAEQQRVVDHPIGIPATVDAGAGTGKTHTVVARVVALHKSGACPASRILLLTFGRKAAAELRARVLRELGPDTEPPHCATFHSFAHDVLLDHAYDIGLSPDTIILEDADARLLFRSAYNDLVLGRLNVDPSAFPLRRADDLVSGLFRVLMRLKQSAITPDEFERNALVAGDSIASIAYRQLRQRYVKRYQGQDFKIVAEIDDARLAHEAHDYAARVRAATALFRHFDNLLQQRTSLTYADLLFRADVEVRRRPELRDELRRRFTHCIVDEYQDTDVAQHHFLQAVFGDSLERVVAVGDVRQSIYAFRGAHPENMDEFAVLAGCVPFRLTESRRSRQEILDFAHRVIAEDRGDETPLRAHRGPAGARVVTAASMWQSDGVRRNATAQRLVEAEWLAAQIASRLSQGDVHPRDVAVLLRYKTNTQIYTDALLRAGVPFQLAGGVGFYDAPEVLDALAWLRLLADPLDSHAAARIVQSPVFGANDADVVALSADLDGSDATAFARRVFVEPLREALSVDGRVRIARLRATLDALEQFAGQSLTSAFPAVLDRAGLRLYFEQHADRRAPQALANLRKLEQLAVGFAQRNPGASASDFVGYVDELESESGDEREADASDVDAVVITTVHNAKGLEWPVVFVADVWPDNTRSDLVRLDADGALLCSEDGEGHEPFHVIARRCGADADGWVPRDGDRPANSDFDREERRLFYVALTRARDEVHISGKRRIASKANPYGTAHAFMDETYAWLAEMGWPVDAPLPDQPTRPAARTPERPSPEQRQGSDIGDFLSWMRPRDVRVSGTSALPLSFSLIRRFEQCPRSVAYASRLGIPPLAADHPSDFDALTNERPDREPDSLLGLGEYGDLVHRALELWAVERIAGRAAVAGADAMRQAAQELGQKPSKIDMQRAAGAFGAMTSALAAWTPLFAEAPFTLDVEGVTVSGFIDLIARDHAGHAAVIDYKTGASPTSDYVLQLALYREAARAAYGVEAIGIIARIHGGAVMFEPVPDLDRAAIAGRVRAAAEGIARADDTPRPGTWCFTCPYRAAPCMSFPRS
jgi:ATP-dependent DNA helicase UvrD/PcrA